MKHRHRLSVRCGWNGFTAAATLIVAGILIVYGQTLSHDFIMYDDVQYVIANPHVQAGLEPSSIRWAFTAATEGTWQPLVWLSLLLDYHNFGLNPMGFHLTNLLLHITNFLALLFLLWSMTGSLWRSAFAAALFALHPLHVESVRGRLNVKMS